MKRICFGFCDSNTPHAGFKAPRDAVYISTNICRYEYIAFSCKNDNFLIGAIRPFLELHIFRQIKRIKNSIVFINHPFTLFVMLHYGYSYLAKKNYVILLSHDLDFIRMHKKKRKILQQFSKAECLIVHNEKYADVLRAEGIHVPMVSLQIFDYILNNKKLNFPIRYFARKISFVGNLDKSEFITEWAKAEKSYQIELIGSCRSKTLEQISQYNCYKGVFPSDDVPYQITGAFGLVWDGSSVETCDGLYGEYLKINNPHKASLYLACGIPVIIWSQAALADFVMKNEVGFLIDSLNDIESILDSMTEEKYQEMINNIKPIQSKIQGGGFLKEALSTAERIIEDSEKL